MIRYILIKNLNKKQIVLRLITPPKSPKGPYWSREYKILNKLMEQFPDQGFWNLLKFNEGWDSLLIFQSDYGQSLLRQKYKEWKYPVQNNSNKTIKFDLTNKPKPDKIIEIKPKTLRDFLS